MAPPIPRLLLLSSLLLLCLTIPALAHSGHHEDDETEPDTNDSETPHNLRSRPLILVKIWCLIIIFFGTFLPGVSPYFFKWNEGFLVLGIQFAGGVFLGTAMMHFLSDSNETFKDLTQEEYPFAFMLACGGFLLTMLADCVISYVFLKNKSVVSAADLQVQSNTEQGKGGQYGTQGHNQNVVVASATSLGDSILLIVALCFHSVFEGIAIGIAKTKADAWKALWTISLHKVFAAIAMGIALLRMMPNRPFLSCAACAFAFAISSPIGVAIGILIDATTQGAVADWIFAISMALACGVFIYIAINHLLAKGYAPNKAVSVDKPQYKFLAVLLGIGVIAVVMIWDT
ncbi:zinc transporter 11-like [Pyrus ussuriensis x Pyrus communis]|uniref:Zinc transporter 11-like n=1 Tax=Pyrus ussuriensis x Pyrus communis TaxID=2448454 RepID=A0A5N5GIX1_9ROSA|nr:zinc transporter 11-like [Pyrus ussuriensis x Pyrus communis]